MTADRERLAAAAPVASGVRCNYGHTEADHERVGACERPPLPGPGFSLLVVDVVGEALARTAVACQGCGALVLRNLNAIQQHRRHEGQAPTAALDGQP